MNAQQNMTSAHWPLASGAKKLVVEGSPLALQIMEIAL